MKKMKLSTQLVVYIIVTGLIPIFCLSIYYDMLTRNVIRQDVVETKEYQLEHVMDGVDSKYNELILFTDWISMDKNILALLEADEKDSVNRSNEAAIETIKEHFLYNNITEHMTALFILGNNGTDIRNGVESPLIESSMLKKESWYKKSLEVNRLLYWGGMIENYNPISYDSYIVPVVRLIKNIDTGQELGTLVIFLKSDYFVEFHSEKTKGIGRFYLFDENGQNMSSFHFTQNEYTKIDILESDEGKIQHVLSEPQKNGSVELGSGTNQSILTYAKSDYTGWTLIEIAMFNEMNEQKRMVDDKIKITLTIMLIVILLLEPFWKRYFVKPIERLTEHMNAIASGTFDKKIYLDSNRDFVMLSQTINKMGEDIDSLIKEKMEENKKNRELELKLLQGQMTPHFLYNTLNSIKSMAQLQRSYGIEKMTSSLGRLLKATYNNKDEHIQLNEEIKLLDEYMYIQKIRYKGKIRYRKEIHDESLLLCQIPKFILQPIAENAIFHGIEPAREYGDICLKIQQNNEELHIQFLDNGIGIDESSIRELNRGKLERQSKRGSNMGLNNIMERIHLLYGTNYGLRFESELGKQTVVTIVLPITF